MIEEIQSFARDFINDVSFRTSVRKGKIRKAYKAITGKDIQISCNTCYIEALLLIINSKPMSARNYELKKGVLLQAFGDASKTCTNDTLTDELAKWYLENYPEKIIYFEKVPGKVIPSRPVNIPPDVKIVEPLKEEPVEILKQTVDSLTKEPKTEPKKKTNKAKK
jgi:hypothetical protein